MKCECGNEVDPEHLKAGQTYIAFKDKDNGMVKEVFCSMQCFGNSRGGHNRRD